MPVTFQMLLTLVSSSNAENAETLWGFIGRYRPGVTPQTHPKLERARSDTPFSYFRDFVAPAKEISRAERGRAQGADSTCAMRCRNCPGMRPPKRCRTWSMRSAAASRSSTQKKKAKDGKPGVSLDWFNMLYQVLLGQEKGPRFGSFVAVYGIDNTVGMIDGALARSA